MPKITPIDGGKKDITFCMHCGVFPAEDHPANSCPRIQAATDDGWEYVNLHSWEMWLEGHDMKIPGVKE